MRRRYALTAQQGSGNSWLLIRCGGGSLREIGRWPQGRLAGRRKNWSVLDPPPNLISAKAAPATIEEEVEITEHVPFIEMVSPSDPPQKFKMYFKSGNFQSIKSVVRVRKSGSRKTVSRIEFIGEANPIVIRVSLGELPRQ